MKTLEEAISFVEQLQTLQEEGKDVDAAIGEALTNLPLASFSDAYKDALERLLRGRIGVHKIYRGAEWHKPAVNPTDLIFRTDQARSE